MKDKLLYKILKPFVFFFVKVFLRPKYLNKQYIPSQGRIILAGNHTHILDCLVLICSTKREIHFLAKDELFHGPKKLLFSHVGLIPVNRSIHDKDALRKAKECLNNDLVIGIFPEGTTEKGRGLLPFKIGAVKMASDTNTMIIPFKITGKYKLFSRSLTIKFHEPIKVTNSDLSKENDHLRNIIKDMEV